MLASFVLELLVFAATNSQLTSHGNYLWFEAVAFSSFGEAVPLAWSGFVSKHGTLKGSLV